MHGADVPGGIDMPDGWVDLIQTFIQEDVVFPARWGDGQAGARLTSIGVGSDGELALNWSGEPTLEQQGRAAFAQAMARRVDQVTGAIGPMDDAGVAEWARR
jgi:hypothetical protein